MLENLKLSNILFLDIETVPIEKSFNDLHEKLQYHWERKSARFREKEETAEDVFQRAGIYSEFGKIICISVGIIHYTGEEKSFRIKSFYGDDEKDLLTRFAALVNQMEKNDEVYLAAHNGKEFDFPYIARRMLVNSVKLPKVLDVPGKKPWEVKFIDTMELWKFGDYKHFTSLDLLTHVFDIPTPKDDIDGSMVGKVYWEDGDLERIVQYCEKDVLAVAQLLLRYRIEDIIKPEAVESVKSD
jgi:hypothetical protein